MDAVVLMEAEGVQYGLELKPKPDARQKAKFAEWINIALQNTREQRPGIDLNDAIYFMSMLESGADLLDLEKELEYAIEKNKEVQQQQSAAMIQQQAQANIQAQQAKDQSAAQLMQVEGQQKMQEEAMRGNVKDSLLTKEYNWEFLKRLQDAANAEKGLETTKTSNK
jgi:hypothetical protein